MRKKIIEDGRDIIKVLYMHTYIVVKFNTFFKAAHGKIKECANLKASFLSILSKCLPNIDTLSEDSLYNVFTRKLCNTRIQEFISSTKQQMAFKKGLAPQ